MDVGAAGVSPGGTVGIASGTVGEGVGTGSSVADAVGLTAITVGVGTGLGVGVVATTVQAARSMTEANAIVGGPRRATVERALFDYPR